MRAAIWTRKRRQKMKLMITQFVRGEEGQDLIEYALLAALVALAATVAMTNLGTSISSVFGSVTGKLTSSVPAA
jgi:pilus assembly protein Flp/PilA